MNMELVFVVFSAGGYGEIRISSDGNVRVADGSPASITLDGISFPAEGARIPSLQRNDVLPVASALATPPGSDLLFHYTTTEKALKYILPNETLRLAPYEKTNDPRENKEWLFTLACRGNVPQPGEALRISKELNSAIKEMTRLCCFCANAPRGAELADSQGAFHSRMWAQYGEDHKGVVLIFDGKRLLPAVEKSLSSLGLVWLGPVEYVEHHDPRNVGFFLEYDEVISTPLKKLADKLISARLPWLFFTKHKDWAQEEEVRLVMLPRDSGEYFIPISRSLLEIGIGADFPGVHLGEVRSHAGRLGCTVSQVLWRNGFPVRTPITP